MLIETEEIILNQEFIEDLYGIDHTFTEEDVTSMSEDLKGANKLLTDGGSYMLKKMNVLKCVTNISRHIYNYFNFKRTNLNECISAWHTEDEILNIMDSDEDNIYFKCACINGIDVQTQKYYLLSKGSIKNGYMSSCIYGKLELIDVIENVLHFKTISINRNIVDFTIKFDEFKSRLLSTKDYEMKDFLNLNDIDLNTYHLDLSYIKTNIPFTTTFNSIEKASWNEILRRDTQVNALKVTKNDILKDIYNKFKNSSTYTDLELDLENESKTISAIEEYCNLKCFGISGGTYNIPNIGIFCIGSYDIQKGNYSVSLRDGRVFKFSTSQLRKAIISEYKKDLLNIRSNKVTLNSDLKSSIEYIDVKFEEVDKPITKNSKVLVHKGQIGFSF